MSLSSLVPKKIRFWRSRGWRAPFEITTFKSHFWNRCKSPVWESVQIVHQRANHLLQISSYRVNLCLQINYFVCKSGTSADENRLKISVHWCFLFWRQEKKNDSFVKYGSTLIYVKILLSCWIANMTSTSKLQTIQVLKVLCKGTRVPQNLCC